MAPWADLLYACDGEWWLKNNGLPAFGGLKLTQDARPEVQALPGLHRVTLKETREEILTDEPGVIGCARNSGFQMVNLAAQLGVARIVLVGFDMRVDLGVHWHADHNGGLTNPTAPTVVKWRRSLDAAAPKLRALGIEVLNASPDSALLAYPKMTLTEALCRPLSASSATASRTGAIARSKAASPQQASA